MSKNKTENKTIPVIAGPYVYDEYGQMINNKETGSKVADMRGYGSLINKYGEERASVIQDNTGRMLAASYNMTYICSDIVEEYKTSNTVSQSNIDKLRTLLDNISQPTQKEKTS